MGESLSDYFASTIGPKMALLGSSLGLAIALIWQFRVAGYVPWIYWLTVAMVAIFGTIAADEIHHSLGIAYAVSTLVFVVILAIIFGAWYWSEKNLDFSSINTPLRETFYWAVVIATFVLGTAAGDWTANNLHLGHLTSGIMFGLQFLLVVWAYYSSGYLPILNFWLAYILTRPLGASFADWMGSSEIKGNLGWGHGSVGLGLTVLFLGLVYYLNSKSSRIKNAHGF